METHVTPVLNGDCGPPGALLAALGPLYSSAFPGGYGEPFDPTWIKAETGIAWGWCDGWGSMHGTH